MGGKGGGGGNVQTPSLYTPSGFYQGLSELEGLGTYGQSLFNPLSSMINWASSIATGGAAEGIGSYGANSLVTGPQINIGGSHKPADQWTTQFNPQTGQVTLTNTMTGEQMMEGVTSPQLQSWFANQGGGPQTLQQWTQQWQQATGGTGTSGGGVSTGPFGPGGPNTGSNPMLAGGGNNWGPQLNAAWDQIEGIGNLEAETGAWTREQQLQAGQLYGEGQKMLRQATTGLGTYPSQTAWINQGVSSEQASLQQQLASEGLGSSTAAGVLKGEAAQQGAATAGQLIEGNISAAQNQIALSQASQKLALGGQELSLGENTAMAQLSLGFQQQMWSQAMQGYGAMGSLMSTLGNLYGIDIQGYSNLLSSHLQMAQLQAQVQEADAGLQAQGAASMGSGLGSILGLLSGGGGAGGGAGGGGGGGLLGGLGSLFGGIGGTTAGVGGLSALDSSVLGGGAASVLGGTGGAAAAGGGGLLGGLGSLIGGAGSGIGSAIGGLVGLIAAF
ncbi:MAG TPA: hypothetical protein VK673_21795 [Chthoniobacterales bacterium]|nr:hypothetical protein [Chthoniobacterales bacterium]